MRKTEEWHYPIYEQIREEIVVSKTLTMVDLSLATIGGHSGASVALHCC